MASGRARPTRIFAAALLTAAATACDGCLGLPSPVDGPGSTLAKQCDEAPPAIAAQPLDVLFVIDNSRSMSEEQAAVAAELTAFVDALKSFAGVEQDIRVGVITTSVYERWRDLDTGFENFKRCDQPGDQHFCTEAGRLQPVPDANPAGGVVPGTGSQRMIDSKDPELVAKFARLVQQGTSGSGQETPFEALRLAFSPPLIDVPVARGGNGDFMRDGARLLIVVLTDEDDCSERAASLPRVFVADRKDVDFCGGANANSLTPVSEYYDFLAGLKGADGSLKDITYAVIGPVGVMTKAAMAVLDTSSGPATLRNIDCATSWGAGIRHREMAARFNEKLENLDSICRANYRDTLVGIAALTNVPQVLDVQGVADPSLLRFVFTRADGHEQVCSLEGGDFTFQPATADKPLASVRFNASCLRRRDDTALKLLRLCIQ